MSGPASIDSIEILKSLRVSLCKFAEVAQSALDEADAEIRRAEHWLSQEQYGHWKARVRQCQELVTRAKVELVQRRSREAMYDHRSSCIDEKKALAAAQRRMEQSEERLVNVRRWLRQFEKEAFTYRGASAGLAQTVEADIPNALARLDNMITALEAYAPTHAPAEQASKAPPVPRAPAGSGSAADRQPAPPLPADQPAGGQTP